MVTLTAARALASNMYKSTDFDPARNETISKTNVEYIIDDLIDWINTEAGTSIAAMTGAAGAKTVTLTSAQNAVLSMVLPLILSEKQNRVNTSTSLGPASISESVAGMDKITKKLFYQALSRLRSRSFTRT